MLKCSNVPMKAGRKGVDVGGGGYLFWVIGQTVSVEKRMLRPFWWRFGGFLCKFSAWQQSRAPTDTDTLLINTQQPEMRPCVCCVWNLLMPVKMNKTPLKSNHVWEDLFAGAGRVCTCVCVVLSPHELL